MQTKVDKKTRLIADIVLIALLLAFGLSALFISHITKKKGREVTVSVNGDTVATYDLSYDGRYSINGGTNVLVIEDGYAFIEYADCPDGTCIRTGKICSVGERIVCLPNKVMVEIE